MVALISRVTEIFCVLALAVKSPVEKLEKLPNDGEKLPPNPLLRPPDRNSNSTVMLPRSMVCISWVVHRLPQLGRPRLSRPSFWVIQVSSMLLASKKYLSNCSSHRWLQVNSASKPIATPAEPNPDHTSVLKTVLKSAFRQLLTNPRPLICNTFKKASTLLGQDKPAL